MSEQVSWEGGRTPYFPRQHEEHLDYQDTAGRYTRSLTVLSDPRTVRAQGPEPAHRPGLWPGGWRRPRRGLERRWRYR